MLDNRENATPEVVGEGPVPPLCAEYVFRQPSAKDGIAVWRLIAACPPLDQNSLYCNLLQCTHFSRTCVLAERDGETRGWLSAYRLPDEPDTIFIWQIAVLENARGEGLGIALLAHLLARPNVRDAMHIKATVTPQNKASLALFESVARHLNAPIKKEEWFQKEKHFKGQHETELLVSIGPFGAAGQH